jgi:hypothetical protein
MNTSIRIGAALALALAVPAALACGACIEDKVAATYDFAVVERAQSDHRVVVFAEIRGDQDAAKLERAAASAAKRTRGIDPASVRSAHAPLALSFALDGGIVPEAALSKVAKAAKMPGLELEVVRVMR